MVKGCDFLIVGAGIVGLTVAWELRKRYPQASITVLEKETNVGQHASGRNSGVLHSGVYYGVDTLKAKVCSAGAAQMRLFADEYGVAYHRSGKIIVAASDKDVSTINRLLHNAENNGINVQLLDEYEIKKIEPYATPHQFGIYSPDTAVIDSKAVVVKLYELLKSRGVRFEINAPLIAQNEREKTVSTPRENFFYGYLYNCAGANADRVAKLFGRGLDYMLIPFKGVYYKLHPSKSHFVNGSIYPVPDDSLPFLGVHLTRVVNGDVYVGPTAIPAFGRENYGLLKGIELVEGSKIGTELLNMYLMNKDNFRFLVHSEVKKYMKPWFVKSAQKLMSGLQSKDLVSCGKVGIRPQLVNVNTKSLEMDFIIECTDNTLHVLNSISPAFTSSFSFSEWVVDRSEKCLL
jgi:(S)-2-hydroxyglutarate dehydrogenase